MYICTYAYKYPYLNVLCWTLGWTCFTLSESRRTNRSMGRHSVYIKTRGSRLCLWRCDMTRVMRAKLLIYVRERHDSSIRARHDSFICVRHESCTRAT